MAGTPGCVVKLPLTIVILATPVWYGEVDTLYEPLVANNEGTPVVAGVTQYAPQGCIIPTQVDPVVPTTL